MITPSSIVDEISRMPMHRYSEEEKKQLIALVECSASHLSLQMLKVFEGMPPSTRTDGSYLCSAATSFILGLINSKVRVESYKGLARFEENSADLNQQYDESSIRAKSAIKNLEQAKKKIECVINFHPKTIEYEDAQNAMTERLHRIINELDSDIQVQKDILGKVKTAKKAVFGATAIKKKRLFVMLAFGHFHICYSWVGDDFKPKKAKDDIGEKTPISRILEAIYGEDVDSEIQWYKDVLGGKTVNPRVLEHVGKIKKDAQIASTNHRENNSKK